MPPLIDWDHFEEVTMGEVQFQYQFISKFLEVLEADAPIIAQLEELSERECKDWLHKLRGGACSIGAQRLVYFSKTDHYAELRDCIAQTRELFLQKQAQTQQQLHALALSQNDT